MQILLCIQTVVVHVNNYQKLLFTHYSPSRGHNITQAINVIFFQRQCFSGLVIVELFQTVDRRGGRSLSLWKGHGLILVIITTVSVYIRR